MADSPRRRNLARHLSGRGIEIGPGHAPYALPDPEAVEIRYVDRWQPDELKGFFPELSGETISKPDIVGDLNRDGLRMLADQCQDFVIASHILEHVANPLQLISEVYRVLSPGGLFLILLPDRRKTFDHKRPATALEHLVAEYEAGVEEVDDAHIFDQLIHTDLDSETLALLTTDIDIQARQDLYRLHRDRSVHAHCWTLDEFLPVLFYCAESLRQAWEFVDGVTTEEGGSEGFEFGFLLRRSASPLARPPVATHFHKATEIWLSTKRQELEAKQAELRQRREAEALAEALDREVQALNGELESLRAQVHDLNLHLQDLCDTQRASDQSMQALLDTKTFRYTRALRRIYGAIYRQLHPRASI